MKIDRRHLLLGSAGLLTGCGGNGKPSNNIEYRTQVVGIEGGTIALPNSGIKLTVPPGSLSNKTNITLNFTNEFSSTLDFNNISGNISVQISENTLMQGESVEISGNLAYSLSPDSDLIALITNNPQQMDITNTVILPVGIQGNSFGVTIEKSDVEIVSRSKSRGITSSFVAFVASLKTRAELYKYVGNTCSGTTCEWGKEITEKWQDSKRRCVVVHGMLNSIFSMNLNGEYHLAKFLSTLKDEKGNLVYPGGVYGIDYNYLARISKNADMAADIIQSKITDKTIHIDLYAHSMGGLVSRWMSEKTPLGKKIGRLFIIATPNRGVPAEIAVKWLCNLGIISCIAGNSVPAGIEDLYRSSNFQSVLNDNSIPENRNLYYFTVAGTNDDYHPPLGGAIQDIYNSLNEGFCDGVVSVNSVQNAVLKIKSSTYNDDRQRRLHQNHADIRQSPETKNLISKWINATQNDILDLDGLGNGDINFEVK